MMSGVIITVNQENIIEWDGLKASEYHAKTTMMMSSWAVIDLFGLIEKYIFRLLDIFVRANPQHLMRGKEYRDLRRIFNARKNSDDSETLWKAEFNKRIESWKRKRLYDGIDKVFLNYLEISEIRGLDPYRWDIHVICIKAISMLRNCLIHGQDTVPSDLAEQLKHKNLAGIRLNEGEPLIFGTEYLQSIELYLNNLITELNKSLMERAINEQ